MPEIPPEIFFQKVILSSRLLQKIHVVSSSMNKTSHTRKAAKAAKPATQPAAPVVALPTGKRSYGLGQVVVTTFKHDGADLASLISTGKFRNQAEAIKFALRLAAASL